MPADETVGFNPPAPLARMVLRDPNTGATLTDIALLLDSNEDSLELNRPFEPMDQEKY